MNGHLGKPQTARPAAITFPQAVDDLARDHGSQTWVSVAADSDLKTGWRHITYGELANAVDGMARWIERQVGRGNGEEVVAYMGINDHRYAAVQVALIKTGFKALLPSPRNSSEGQASLVEKTGCKILLHSDGMSKFVDIFKNSTTNLRTLEIPSFDDVCKQGSLHGHYAGHYNNAEDHSVLILHTSGSTGLPKPIYLTHGGLAIHRTMLDVPPAEGRTNSQQAIFASDNPLLVMTPFFHAMGAIMLSRSLICRGPMVLLPPEKPPNAQLIVNVIRESKPWAGIFAPAILEQIAGMPDGLATLSLLKYAFFGGAPLAIETGEEISKVTNLVSVIGSTEAGLIASRLPLERRDWPYFEFAPEAGVDMEPEDDGTAELVIKPVNRKAQGIFFTFPDITEWRTKDVWKPHPSKPNLWKYAGRKDDVIVLSNGEKHNPVGFEKSLESIPLVKGALVVGQGRFQTALIIEPRWESLQRYDPSELLDQLWPAIEKANADCPAHGRVWKSKVAFAKQEKPFKRAPKGSIVRQHTIRLYGPEIEALYSNEGSDEQLGQLDAHADRDTTKKFLRDVFKVKGFAIPEDASGDADIFNFGVDSLQVLALSSTLNHARKGCRGDTVSPRDIYQYPTIDSMARFLQGDTANGTAPSREDAMAEMLEKYTHDLPSPRSSPVAPLPAKHTVILTGSTGSLGNSILEDLITSSSVDKVYCLNRSADAGSRQRSSFKARDATADFSKVTFLHSDFSKDRLGLSQADYDNLLQTATIIIHNAWAVDFNKSLQTYETVHIAGTRRCVDFSHQSKYGAHLVFISSVASVGNWRAKHPNISSVPEELYEDHELPLPQGYGESKHTSSLILAHAAKKSEIASTVVRAGQLAGPRERGQVWNKHEWLPSIVLSSKAIGVLPQQLGNQDTIDWVPIDTAARSVVDIAEARSQQVQQNPSLKLATTHLVNPRISSWSELALFILESLKRETGRDIQAVPFEAWLEKLASVPQTTEEAERVPGIKLLDFYRGLVPASGGLPALATTETAKLSSTVANMAAVDSPLMGKWLAQWQ